MQNVPGIIAKRYDEWTGGLSPIKARISIFEHIRDIPYRVIPELRNRETGPTKLLEGMTGSCTPKHHLLFKMFELLGTEARLVTYPYYWDDPMIEFPDEIRRLSSVLKPEYHLACHVKIEGHWIKVDATLDLPLAKAGYPVNEAWDGMSDTKIAVTPLDEIIHETPADRDEYVKKMKSEWTDDDFKNATQFNNALNSWLETLRK